MWRLRVQIIASCFLSRPIIQLTGHPAFRCSRSMLGSLLYWQRGPSVEDDSTDMAPVCISHQGKARRILEEDSPPNRGGRLWKHISALSVLFMNGICSKLVVLYVVGQRAYFETQYRRVIGTSSNSSSCGAELFFVRLRSVLANKNRNKRPCPTIVKVKFLPKFKSFTAFISTLCSYYCPANGVGSMLRIDIVIIISALSSFFLHVFVFLKAHYYGPFDNWQRETGNEGREKGGWWHATNVPSQSKPGTSQLQTTPLIPMILFTVFKMICLPYLVKWFLWNIML